MKGKTKQHWMALCEQAAVEQDSEKLLELHSHMLCLILIVGGLLIRFNNEPRRAGC